MTLNELKPPCAQWGLALPLRLEQAREQGMAYLEGLAMIEKMTNEIVTETRKPTVNALLRVAESSDQPWLAAACLWALVLGHTQCKAITDRFEQAVDIEPLVTSGTSPPGSIKGYLLQDNFDFYYH